MQEATDRQREVLETIRRLARGRGYPPTVREIADELEIQPNAVMGHLRLLEAKGLITRTPGKGRTILLTAGAKE